MKHHPESHDNEAAIMRQIVRRVPMQTARALSRTIMDMVADGDLKTGTPMPRVRSMAKALNMSATSVAQAWRELVDWHVLDTKRRGGTSVLGMPRAPRAERFSAMQSDASKMKFNLAFTLCDAAMVPPLDQALMAAAKQPSINDYRFTPISDALRDAVLLHWPFKPSFMLATHGGLCAAEMALRTCLRPGDRVIVEVPCVPRVFDVLDSIGAKIIPLTQGPQGPDLDQLAKALKGRPAAFLYQPSGHLPTGRNVSAHWIDEAAQLLRESHIAIIELVMTPFLSDNPALSLGKHLPHSVVHIQSFNFFFGPNLRVGVAGGSDYYIDRMARQFTFASRWVSRLLQDAVAYHLTNKAAQQNLAEFCAECRHRHESFVAALKARGFDVEPSQSQMIWLPVKNEQSVCEAMAAEGVMVHRGSFYSCIDEQPNHIVLNATLVASAFEHFAALLAKAEGAL